jgi:hypothetical protein
VHVSGEWDNDALMGLENVQMMHDIERTDNGVVDIATINALISNAQKKIEYYDEHPTMKKVNKVMGDFFSNGVGEMVESFGLSIIGSRVFGENKPSGKNRDPGLKVDEGNIRPVQQIKNRFPDDIQTGKEFSFSIENGYLKNTKGLTEVDFVVDVSGNLHIGRGHSFLAKGESVQAAGKLTLNGQGQVRSISNLSGHYTPTVEQAKLFPQVLEQAGVRTKNAWLDIYTIETTPSGYVNTSELVKISSTQIK